MRNACAREPTRTRSMCGPRSRSSQGLYEVINLLSGSLVGFLGGTGAAARRASPSRRNNGGNNSIDGNLQKKRVAGRVRRAGAAMTKCRLKSWSDSRDRFHRFGSPMYPFSLRALL